MGLEIRFQHAPDGTDLRRHPKKPASADRAKPIAQVLTAEENSARRSNMMIEPFDVFTLPANSDSDESPSIMTCNKKSPRIDFFPKLKHTGQMPYPLRLQAFAVVNATALPSDQHGRRWSTSISPPPTQLPCEQTNKGIAGLCSFVRRGFRPKARPLFDCSRLSVAKLEPKGFVRLLAVLRGCGEADARSGVRKILA
jgi:hypothetical protein